MLSVSQLPGQWIVNSALGVRASHALLGILSSGSPALPLDDGIGDAPVFVGAWDRVRAIFLAMCPIRTLVLVDTLVQCTRCPASGLMKLPPMEADASASIAAFTSGGTVSRLESSMSSVEIEQKAYEMPPREGISIAQFLTVANIERSARYYEKVFGARILSLGDGNAPGYLQLANIWMILNVGGGPTPDKPTVTLSVPDPNHINSFMNFRVADIQACYELWKSRGAEFITEPIPKYGEIRCYIRDPDGYIIEVGQSTDLTYG
jgi:catechol 2,3-dioxygenase-like lactoylglutathione lyase family enzyme